MQSNLSIDADAQLRMLPAVAPVGRRSSLRCTGTAAPLSPESILRSPRLRLLEARRSVWSSRPLLVGTPRTAAGFICVGARSPSRASSPKEAEHSFGAAAEAVGSGLSQASMPVWRPSIGAVAGAVGKSRCGLRACEHHSQEVQPRARYNRSVDSDAQLRMLPAVAPVDRRSPLRYSGSSRSAPPHVACGLRAPRPSRADRSAWACRPCSVGELRTAVAFLLVRARRQSLALCAGRAVAPFGAVANAARFTPSARWCESRGRRLRPSEARSRAGHCGPLNCERRRPGVRQEPRHNEAVDSDAQLRTLPAVAPVGRRSPRR